MGRKLFDGKGYEETIRKLETAWSLGCPDTEAALLADISSASLCEFLKAHPKIAERKEQLKENPVLKARAALYKAIEKGDGKLALQYLERKRRAEFSERKEIILDSQRVEWSSTVLNNPGLAEDISELMGKIAKK